MGLLSMTRGEEDCWVGNPEAEGDWIGGGTSSPCVSSSPVGGRGGGGGGSSLGLSSSCAELMISGLT